MIKEKNHFLCHNFRIKMRKSFFILIIIFSVNVSYGQQDPQVSHYFFMKEFYNPAYAGFEGEVCANLLSHQQWRNIKNAPFTTMLTLDAPVTPFGTDGGVGVSFVDDNYGFVRDFRGNISLSYKIDLGFGKLGIGLSPGVFSKKFTSPTWLFPEQSETILDQEANATIFDMGAGFYYSIDDLYLGLSSFHLFRPNFYFESSTGNKSSIFLVNHFYLMAGYNIRLANSALELTPSVFLKSDGNMLQYDINIFALYNKKIWASVSYRNKDAFAFFIGTSYFNNVRLGLSYDVTISYLNRVVPSSNGSSNVSSNRISNGTIEAYVGYCFSFVKVANAQKYRNVKTL